MIPIKDNIPTDRFPLVTVALILANVVVYVLAVGHGGSLFSGPDAHELVRYGAMPYALTHSAAHTALPAWETVFTAMFMHASILHIAGNMLFLWIFGNNVEDSMGPVKFLALLPRRRPGRAGAAGGGGPQQPRPDGRRLGRDRRRARRLHRAVSPRPGADAGVHHPVLHGDRAAGAGDARACGSPSRRCSGPPG